MTERKLRELARLSRQARATMQARDEAIRKAVAEGTLSQRQIARAVGLSHTRVQQIVRAGKK